MGRPLSSASSMFAAWLLILATTCLPLAAGMRHTVSVGRPPLCDPIVVEETCMIFDGDGSTLSPEDLEEVLAATSESVGALWKDLGLHDGAATTCQELCLAVIGAIGKTSVLPPSCDVGCYKVGDETICDLNLDEDAVNQKARVEGDLPNFGKRAHRPAGKRLGPALPAKSGTDAVLAVDYSLSKIQRRVANLFRIYPAQERRRKRGSLVELSGKSTAATNASMERDDPDPDVYFQKVSLQSLVYVENAIEMFRAKNTKAAITTWFGREAYTSKRIRKKVQSTLNSIANVLSSFTWVYPGPECEDDTFAYVDPTGSICEDPDDDPDCTKTDDGDFVFFMCPLALRSKLSVTIETMTHEASHHYSAYTDDVDFDGDTAYGRDTCKELAKEDPSEALDNAENFCFYIQDVTDRPRMLVPIDHSGDDCEGRRKKDCTDQCTWEWTGDWRTSCDALCDGRMKEECVGKCDWDWTGSWHSSCQNSCEGESKEDCLELDGCKWEWTGNWRTSCV